jgi:hypothetical protein
MKSRILIAAVVAATSLPAFMAVGEDVHAYALITTGVKETWFLDLKSVAKADPSTAFWALDVEDPSAGKTSYAALQYSIDCLNQRMTTLYVAAYAVDGSLLTSGTPGDTGSPIIPGSIGEAFGNYICKGIDPFPKTGTLDDTNKAVAAGHELIEAAKKPSQPRGLEHHKASHRPSSGDGGI